MVEFKVCKQGVYHIDNDINNQDGAIIINSTTGMILDGCSECNHSDLGVKLFMHYVKKMYSGYFDRVFFDIGFNYMKKAFIYQPTVEDSGALIEYNNSIINNFLLFTILTVKYDNETNEFIVNYVGDGYIILVCNDNSVKYINLDNGEYSPYYGYNFYIDKNIEKPTKFPDSTIKTQTFKGSDYKYAGVSSDGLRYILELKNSEYQNRSDLFDKFEKALIDFRPERVERICNILKSTEYRILQDDFSLVLISRTGE
jgi:hypothetical protein